MASCGSEHACSATKLKYAFPSAEDVVVRYGVLDIFLDFCARARDVYQRHQSVDTFLDGPSALKKEENRIILLQDLRALHLKILLDNK